MFLYYEWPLKGWLKLSKWKALLSQKLDFFIKIFFSTYFYMAILHKLLFLWLFYFYYSFFTSWVDGKNINLFFILEVRLGMLSQSLWSYQYIVLISINLFIISMNFPNFWASFPYFSPKTFFKSVQPNLNALTNFV